MTLYDSATGQKTRAWTLDGAHRNPRLAPDGKLWVMERTKANLSVLHDAVTGEQLGVSFLGDNSSSPWSWSADSQNIVTPYLNNMVIADARTRRQLAQFFVAPDAQALALDPRGDTLYTLDDQGKIWRWRMR